jgi:hypothetical protein
LKRAYSVYTYAIDHIGEYLEQENLDAVAILMRRLLLMIYLEQEFIDEYNKSVFHAIMKIFMRKPKGIFVVIVVCIHLHGYQYLE